jgi:hypothetical protein
LWGRVCSGDVDLDLEHLRAGDVTAFVVACCPSQSQGSARLTVGALRSLLDYDRTHSIGYLTSLLEHHGIDLSEGREQIEELTPWAVAARYEDRFEEVLDRRAVRKQVSVVRD